MSDYFVPSVQVTQEFLAVPTFSEKPLAALIVGPNYKLTRYTEPGEKPSALALNASASSAYVGTQDDFYFQNVPVNSTTDTRSIQVYLDNVLAYFYNPTTAVQVTKVTNTNNQVQGNGGTPLVFKTGAGTSRSAVFSTRDVQPGDTVQLYDSTAGTNKLTTKVAAILPSYAAASNTVTKITGTGDCNVTVAGTFLGSTAITYRIICTKTGTFAGNDIIVKVLSNDVDSFGPIGAVQKTTSYSLGTLGLTFQVTASTATGMTLNDEFQVAVTPAAISKYDILQLTDNIPSGWSGAYIKDIRLPLNDVLIPEVNQFVPGTVNYKQDNTADPTKITLNANVAVTTPTVTSGGVPTALTVASGTVYVGRRDLLQTYTTAINNVTSSGDVANMLGTVHPDNPLAKGVYNAALNAAGTPVYFVAVATNDLAGYNAALELVKKTDKVYGLVPMTFDTTIQDAIIGQANAVSNKKAAKWRVCWFSREMPASGTLLGSQATGDPYRAYVGANPGNSSVYNYVTIGTKVGATLTPDTNVQLLTLGVAPGDVLNFNFQLDAAGNTISTQATVTAVLSQNSFIVNYDWKAAQGTPFKVTITRNYTSAQKVTNYTTGYTDRRVRVVFPDYYKSGTVTEQGYLLAASLAGLRSASVPHQSLTNVEVLGPTDLSRVTSEINETDLDSMAAQGVWIVTQASTGASAYTRDELTTDQSSLLNAKDSIVSNCDSISYGLQKALAPFIGIYNINAGSILKVRAAADKELSYRMVSTYTETAGTQLNGYTIKSAAQDPTFKNKLKLRIGATVPSPMDYIDAELEFEV